MLFRCEGIIALRAELVMLDISVFVLAVRNVVERQVRNLSHRLVELLRGSLFLDLQCRNHFLQFRDFGHQLVGSGAVLLLLRVTDFLRGRVAPRLRMFELLDHRTPALVDGQKPFRIPSQSTPRERTIESVGIVANPFDVVHGEIPVFSSSSVRPRISRPHQSVYRCLARIGRVTRRNDTHYDLTIRMAVMKRQVQVTGFVSELSPAAEVTGGAAEVRAFFSTIRTATIDPS